MLKYKIVIAICLALLLSQIQGSTSTAYTVSVAQATQSVDSTTPDFNDVPSSSAQPRVTTPTLPTPSLQPSIPPAEPTHVAITNTGFSVNVKTMLLQGSKKITPPDLANVWLIGDVPYGYSGLPATNSSGTVYLACHTHSKRAPTDPSVPCNMLQLDIVTVGQDIVLTTKAGELHYKITAKKRIDKIKSASDPTIWGNYPGKLVLITCWYDAGSTTPDALFIFAEIQK